MERKSAHASKRSESKSDGLPRDASTKAETKTASKTSNSWNSTTSACDWTPRLLWHLPSTESRKKSTKDTLWSRQFPTPCFMTTAPNTTDHPSLQILPVEGMRIAPPDPELAYLKENQVETLQVTLNSSLARSMHVYGHTTALCTDMGVPPLRLTQQAQLVQLHFRLTQVYKDSISSILFEITMSRFSDLPP
jgi:hypothetical protein